MYNIIKELEKEIENIDPVRKYLEQQKVIAQKQIEVTKAMTLPKLDAGYHERAYHAAYHGVERGEPVAQKIKNQQHRAAGYGHRPVRVAAENHLDEVVYYRAEEKDKDIAKPVFQYHHRAYF